ncbi:MAG: histidinol dehydrogenase [Proteocatella sp.]
MYYLKSSIKKDIKQKSRLQEDVQAIIMDVAKNGDVALRNYNMKYDQNDRADFLVSKEEIENAYSLVAPELIADIKKAAANIEAFARVQRDTIKDLKDYEVVKGVYLGHRIIPINSCCCYVPGGSYPLYSSALMLAIPAKAAGVKRITACSPTVKGTSSIHPATLVAMDIAGVDEIYALGGAHAIAAFAYGTQQIEPVDIIVGPGNQYVSEAKRQCYGQVGIDFVAGPSEVLIIAEEPSKPAYIASDILAQSEHDVNAKALLLTTSRELAQAVTEEVEKQLQELDTRAIAAQAWENNGEIIIVENLEEAFELSNKIAPEHLEIHLKDENNAIDNLNNYGSLFIGENAAEVFGDYASGTNHTLPTLRASRYTGGVYVGTFLKTCTHQKITKSGIASIAQTSYNMALGEGLSAHANAARQRMLK